MKTLGSDNHSGIHPLVLQAIETANQEHELSYGLDSYTTRFQEWVKDRVSADATTLPVYSGTGANVLAMSLALKPYQSVVCLDQAHIHSSETGAPERFLGSKLLTVSSSESMQGKLTVGGLEKIWQQRGNIHHVEPKLISISQGTECGTVYTIQEIQALARFCKNNDAILHMDGARLMNAAAFLGCDFRSMVRDTGVDVLSFGGTKNGALCAEAVVILNPRLKEGAENLRKQAMQLSSKQRFLSAQWLALLENDLGLSLAAHANAMARQMASEIQDRYPEARIVYPVQMNAVFVELPTSILQNWQKIVPFHFWDQSRHDSHGLSIARLMTSWDSKESDWRVIWGGSN